MVISNLASKRILIFGLGITGKSVLAFCNKHHLKVSIYSDNPDDYHNLKDYPVWDISNGSDVNKDTDLCVISPGISIMGPSIHPLYLKLMALGIEIISDIDLLILTRPYLQYCFVTGTNGKTTTTHLLAHLLKVAPSGNNGVPVLSLEYPEQIAVIELSSFQIERSRYLKQANAVVVFLNLAPDHLSHYESENAYYLTKARLLSAGKQCIINTDTLKYIPDVQIRPSSIFFNAHPTPDGISSRASIYFDSQCRLSGPLLSQSYALHPQVIGRENILAAVAAAKYFNIAESEIIAGLDTFTLPPHRQQLVKKLNKVSCIDDSKATNLHAVGYAFSQFTNIIWLAGGILKEPADSFNRYIAPFHHKLLYTVTFGQAREVFNNYCTKNHLSYASYPTMHEAVKEALTYALNLNDEVCVLLAPGGSSLDEFSSYAVRGMYFQQIIKAFAAYA